MSTQTQQTTAQTMEEGKTPLPTYTKEENDMLFCCLNYCMHHVVPKLETNSRYNFIQVYRKLKKTNPSNFHTTKDLEDFLEL